MSGHTQSWAPPPNALQAEVARRQTAEARVHELEALVAKLRGRIATLEGGRRGGAAGSGGSAGQRSTKEKPSDDDGGVPNDDPIDRAICEYLELNPDFPVSIQKVATNYYVFGDRGTVYVTQRGDHNVVRVGGGFKSLQVFMDERALMVTRENASALTERTQASAP